jgi:hypothetical protein
MMTICQHESCNRPATHAPQLQIPAQGWPIDLHQPVAMFIGVELCKDHATRFGDDFKWSDNLKIKEAVEFITRGRAPPDFERAFHTVVRLDSEAYRTFLGMRGGAT